MLPEFGQIVLILAMMVAMLQCIFGLIGAQTQRVEWMAMVRPAAWVQSGLVALAFALLIQAFVSHDFSVRAVADHTATSLASAYCVAAIWASPQGSVLLWVFVLAMWSLCALRAQTILPEVLLVRLGALLGALSCGCLAYLLWLNNPFSRVWPLLHPGTGLNPLLQNPLMLIHPPILYAGYVGSAVPCAFALAVILHQRIERHWLLWLRPYCLGSWAILTVGIGLGSWWAYRVLGWGGWWFWDPVENISLMPWLIGTALVHLLALSRMRSQFVRLSLFLAFIQFWLVALGTILVRSGGLLSVHSFTASAATPSTLLVVMLLVGLAGVGLFCLSNPGLKINATDDRALLLARDTGLLFTNLMLISACSMVFLGTVYPFMAQTLGLGMISVGTPYYASLFTVLMAPVVALLPIGPWLSRPSSQPRSLPRSLAAWLIFACVGAFLSIRIFPRHSIASVAGVSSVLWVLGVTLQWLWVRWHSQDRPLCPTVVATSLAHCGVGVFVAGALLVGTQEIRHEQAVTLGHKLTIGPYSLSLETVSHDHGPNYDIERFRLRLFDQRQVVTDLVAERHHFPNGTTLTEPGIYHHGWADVYVIVGEPLGQHSWAIRTYYKPFIRWIWIGLGMIAAGGAISALARLGKHQARGPRPR